MPEAITGKGEIILDKKELYLMAEQKEKRGRRLMAVVAEGCGAGSRALFEDGVLTGMYSTREFEETKEPDPVFSEEEKKVLADLDATGPVKINDRRIFAEVLGQQPELVICGGGHVAQQVLLLAVRLGFRTTVLEDRPFFADAARVSGANQVICDEFENGLARILGSADTYFLVVTRGHRYDGICLREILKKPYAYVGMMASRGRAALLKKQLASEGVDQEGLDKLYTPVGLSIHAETPEEIAVSIAAELIQIKNSKKRDSGYDEELMDYLTGRKEPEMRKVLATIISRQGSAPRGVGTKMLVLSDGRLIGTIGGGCTESDVRQQCLHLLRSERQGVSVIHVNLTNQQAGDEGMVCGGRIEVLAEIM